MKRHSRLFLFIVLTLVVGLFGKVSEARAQQQTIERIASAAVLPVSRVHRGDTFSALPQALHIRERSLQAEATTLAQVAGSHKTLPQRLMDFGYYFLLVGFLWVRLHFTRPIFGYGTLKGRPLRSA